jgi:glutamyl-tRNA synthetase
MQNTASQRVTRLAPSPTGALHLGNARTFLINWAMARQRGWKIVLRIEDLDGPRIKEGAAESVIRTLEWLGMEWDEGPIVQSHDLTPYTSAMRALAAEALAYPCALTRAEIEHAASAPHGLSPSHPLPPAEGASHIPPSESRFPRELRPALHACPFDDPETNWRFAAPPAAVEFTDAFSGAQRIIPAETVGDFVIWTKRGQPAYQLAVVVDDHRQGITDIVRGDDLLDSAARQLLLYRALGFAPEPSYTHLPLVIGEDGRRLAKRHGDTRVEHYRAQGVTAERVIGLIAFWSGVQLRREPMAARDFASAFNLERLPPSAAVFTREDDQWLLG